jgi:hypothetical protein
MFPDWQIKAYNSHGLSISHIFLKEKQKVVTGSKVDKTRIKENS